VWSGGFGHDQALRAGEGDVLDEAPTRFRQPVANLIDAVDIAVAHMRGELAGHQRGVEWPGVRCVRPEVGEEET